MCVSLSCRRFLSSPSHRIPTICLCLAQGLLARGASANGQLPAPTPREAERGSSRGGEACEEEASITARGGLRGPLNKASHRSRSRTVSPPARDNRRSSPRGVAREGEMNEQEFPHFMTPLRAGEAGNPEAVTAAASEMSWKSSLRGEAGQRDEAWGYRSERARDAGAQPLRSKALGLERQLSSPVASPDALLVQPHFMTALLSKGGAGGHGGSRSPRSRSRSRSPPHFTHAPDPISWKASLRAGGGGFQDTRVGRGVGNRHSKREEGTIKM